VPLTVTQPIFSQTSGVGAADLSKRRDSKGHPSRVPITLERVKITVDFSLTGTGVTFQHSQVREGGCLPLCKATLSHKMDVAGMHAVIPPIGRD
jgi:hypothetical protein